MLTEQEFQTQAFPIASHRSSFHFLTMDFTFQHYLFSCSELSFVFCENFCFYGSFLVIVVGGVFIFFFLVLLLSNAQICSRIWLSLGIKNRTIKENQKITVFVQLKSVQKTY